MTRFEFDGQTMTVQDLWRIAFRPGQIELAVPPSTHARIEASHHSLLKILEDRIPVYGVTTGFGDSGTRAVSLERAEDLQKNLVDYLLCGSGPVLSAEAGRAVLAIRLNSLCRGFSGVSPQLIERLRLHLSKDWIPVIPREGSLGASGDLIPLAYLAQNIEGQGQVYVDGKIAPMSDQLKREGLEPYRLKAKEGLALVNGTSAMAGLAAINLRRTQYVIEKLSLHTSWLCLALEGRTEAFGPLVNEQAKHSSGQSRIAEAILGFLKEENYRPRDLREIEVDGQQMRQWVQDRYSLRCTPQILGPGLDTLTLMENWLTCEINSASDNPLIGHDGALANGGNFYGGYMSQGMDYLKITLAHCADLIDRQVAYVVDEKSNRGLPPNLSDWSHMSEEERHLHHGLKGLHQATSAITSEVMARATPGGIFSRSSESHNQDKVSLGMSAAVQCEEMLNSCFTLLSLQAVILAQALEIRGRTLQGTVAKKAFDQIRTYVPFVKRDQPLGDALSSLRNLFLREALDVSM
ncbi:MAG: histidine ammonia-lyase [Bdellovibrionales bacterium]